ncbi:MAG: ABC transporter permease [Arachnia sp.]
MTTTARETSATTRGLTYLSTRPVIALLVILVILFGITALRDPSLFTAFGVRSILLLACPLAIMAAAQTLCMLTGGIDLSMAMTANLAAYVCAVNADLGPVTAIVLAFATGAVVGLVTGVGVGVFGVNALIMTLGISSVLVGVVTVGIVGNGFLAGSTTVLPVITSISAGTLAGPIPRNTVVLAVVTVLLVWGLARTGLGRNIYAVGDNPAAARLSGVRTWRVLVAVYVLAGMLAALAGLIFSGVSGAVGPDQTNAYLLPAIAAAVIGGTSILGGVGGFGGAIVGALTLTVLNRLLLGLHTSDAVRQIIYGAIVLGMAWLYVRVTGRRAS